MARVKLANILLEDSRQFHSAPLLYVRKARSVVQVEEGVWVLDGPGSFDFTTFFNALSVLKYDRYTTATAYYLHIELRGAACSVVQTCADKLDYYARPVEGRRADLPASDQWHAVDILIAYQPSDVLAGFIVEAEGPVSIRNAYYSAEVPDGAVRPVELALSTTTFKKEDFICHNIELVRTHILGGNEPIADHFRMYVVDNGRTLDVEALSGDGITVYPNDNVGGSGGFAYGMVRALEEGDVTHILLMDDDVEVSPESIMRTYNLLTIVNDTFAGAFVSGAMMNYDEPDYRWEDVGHMTTDGKYMPVKEPEHLSSLHDCVTNETYLSDEVSQPELRQKYAAWWYCCIPMEVVRANGLPLPFFVRFDDAEYGLRCAPRFMTMNGICIWHLAFAMRYNAAVERYQTMRNNLIGQAVTGVAPYTDFLRDIRFNMMVEMLKFNYADATLICEALEDYLKGPDYFSGKGVVEQRFMDANRNKEQMRPLSELVDEAAELGVDLVSISAGRVVLDFPLGRTPHNKVYNIAHAQMLERTLNGQLGGHLKPFDGPVAIVDGKGWSYQMGPLYGVDTVVAVDVQNKKAAIRHRDNERGRALWARFQEDLARCENEGAEVRAAYAAARERLTSVAFWKDYLGIEDEAE